MTVQRMKWRKRLQSWTVSSGQWTVDSGTVDTSLGQALQIKSFRDTLADRIAPVISHPMDLGVLIAAEMPVYIRYGDARLPLPRTMKIIQLVQPNRSLHLSRAIQHNQSIPRPSSRLRTPQSVRRSSLHASSQDHFWLLARSR